MFDDYATLGDALAAELPALQAEAESRMRRPCVAREVVGVEPDPTTGADVTTYSPPLYTGMCRLRDRNMTTAARDVATAPVTSSRIEWHVPMAAPIVPKGAVVFFEDGTPPHRVMDAAYGDDRTARRYPVEVVS